MGFCSWYVCNVELKKNILQPLPQLFGLRALTLTLMLVFPGIGFAQLTVYPGDANNNGLCSHVDVLYLGLGFGDTGPNRQGGNNSWTPQILPTPWAQSTQDGINHGYIDCNGNGTIDSSDMGAIDANFGQMVSPANPGDTASFASGNAPILAINLPMDSMPVMGTVTFTADITLGSSFFPVDSLYSVAYTIAYDPAIVDQITANPHGGWLANSASPITRSWVDSTNGLIYMVVTNTDHLNRSGFGAIGSIGIVMDDNIRLHANFSLGLDIVFARALRRDGSSYPLIPQGDQMSILTAAVRPHPQLELEANPNPASDFLKVTAPATATSPLQLFNISGKLVAEFRLEDAHNQRLNVSALAPGIYFLEMKTGQGIHRKKILIAR